jgi:hypothetical protein
MTAESGQFSSYGLSHLTSAASPAKKSNHEKGAGKIFITAAAKIARATVSTTNRKFARK